MNTVQRERPRVIVVQPEPTPYRSPLFDVIAARAHVDIHVVYSAVSVGSRPWRGQMTHRSTTTRGLTVPGLARVIRHDYRVTPGVVNVLQRERPDCVVISGWSTFAAQAALIWCRLRGVPYVLLVESNDRDPRSAWRRALKGAVVPRVLRGAARVLVVGSLARESVVRRGARPEDIGVFANTVDVESFAAAVDGLAARRAFLRAQRGLSDDDVAILCVARLSPEKGLRTLLQAVAGVGSVATLIMAGEGRLRQELEESAVAYGARVSFLGGRSREELAEDYSASDVFALLSEHEPWGVVVNEAAAAALPLVLSDRVGAAADLLRPGDNGYLVGFGDVEAAVLALNKLVQDAALRARMGERSREIVSPWTYAASAEAFERAVLSATGRD